MKQFLFAVTSLLILSSASYGQSKWWVSADSVNIFTRNTGGVMIGGVDPLGKLTVNSDRLGFNLALVGDYNNLSKNYLKIGVLGRASNGLDGHTLFDLYHSNTSLKKAGFNFRINEKSAFFINGEGNIGIGTEKPLAGLDITSGPDWGGFKKGLRLSANNAISVESGEMKYGMVGSENALHFFATNGGEKVNPFGSAFAKLMSLQPKKVVIEGDLEVKGKIIYEGGQINGSSSSTGVSNTGSTTTGTGTVDDGGTKDDGGKSDGSGFGEAVGQIIDKPWRGSDQDYNVYWETGNVGIGTTTPAYKLDLNGTARFQGGNVTFPGNGTWTSTGKVGIGNSAPVSLLTVRGTSDQVRIERTVQDYLKIYLYRDGNDLLCNNFNLYYDDQETSAFGYIFSIANNPKMVIKLNGNVGIGTTSPTYKLDVTGTFRSTSTAYFNDKVGIGTTNPDTFKLAVNGTVKAKAFVATANGWADFVFADDYKLMPLNQLEKHVKTHKHLPGIPTEKDVTSNGVDLGEVQAKLLQKVEELTLYVIEQQKEIESLKKENADFNKKLKSFIK